MLYVGQVQEQPKVEKAPDAAALVGAEFPEEPGLRRAINPLWEKGGAEFFRVNFYDVEGQGFAHTHFVMVLDGVVTETK